MTAYPLPPAQRIRDMSHGRGRAARIRDLYAQRCSPAEIALWLRVSPQEVRRTVIRPVAAVASQAARTAQRWPTRQYRDAVRASCRAMRRGKVTFPKIADHHGIPRGTAWSMCRGLDA